MPWQSLQNEVNVLKNLLTTESFQALQKHYKTDIQPYQLKELFQSGGKSRFKNLSWQSQNMLLDISKQRITPKTLKLLFDLARERKVSKAIEDLFSGEKVNWSEDRPALHTALRKSEGHHPFVDGKEIGKSIQANLNHMAAITEQIHQSKWLGYSGKPINTIVNIGVGGSDIGPHMVCSALDEFQVETDYPIDFLFVSSMDGSQLSEMLKGLNQETTLFIVASKTFTTVDTLANAETARSWLRKQIQCEISLHSKHFIGCSAFPERAADWGIPVENQVALWDWVGGRYSLWSGIGLPIALKIGIEGFKQLLAGAEAMDQHVRITPLEFNLPVILALVGIWNINVLGLIAHTILPYDGRLKLLPSYLSQLEMESNGKSVTSTGQYTNYSTSPIIWGEVGANAQHTYFQLLHQGTPDFFADFIVPVRRIHSTQYTDSTTTSLDYQQELNLANCIAQSRVLLMGDDVLNWDEGTTMQSDRLYKGNHPSTTIMLDELTPNSLGSLIALYEHKVHIQATIWDINSFDQWGVELGKQLAKETLNAIQQHKKGSSNRTHFDASSVGLLDYVADQQG